MPRAGHWRGASGGRWPCGSELKGKQSSLSICGNGSRGPAGSPNGKCLIHLKCPGTPPGARSPPAVPPPPRRRAPEAVPGDL